MAQCPDRTGCTASRLTAACAAVGQAAAAAANDAPSSPPQSPDSPSCRRHHRRPPCAGPHQPETAAPSGSSASDGLAAVAEMIIWLLRCQQRHSQIRIAAPVMVRRPNAPSSGQSPDGQHWLDPLQMVSRSAGRSPEPTFYLQPSLQRLGCAQFRTPSHVNAAQVLPTTRGRQRVLYTARRA